MDGYPIFGLFWTMLWFFLFVAWISVLFNIFRDIYRSPDLSGWGKAGWTLLTIILPLIGVLIYLTVRGSGMHERHASDLAEQEAAMASYIRSVADSPSASTSDELAKLAQLRDSGVLTPAEFESQKATLLTRTSLS